MSKLILQNIKNNIDLTPIQYIKGVGPNRAEALAKAGIESGLDALYYFPTGYIDRQARTEIKTIYTNIKRRAYFSAVNPEKDADFSKESTIVAKITDARLRRFGQGRSMLDITINDGSGVAKITFWNYGEFLIKKYQVGFLCAVSGKPTIDKYGSLMFAHPDIDIISKEEEALFDIGGILPKYKMKQDLVKSKINQKMLRTIINVAIEKDLNEAEETLPHYMLEKYHFQDIKHTIKNLHYPNDRETLEQCRRRIKYEELFYYFLRVAERKRLYAKPNTGIVINPKSKKARELYDKLPFQLTKDQKHTLNEIARDCKSGMPMNRLLQGDVGSGKTIVSLLAMLMAVDSGYQTAIMAPTELLCEQHYLSISKFLEGTDIKIVQLVGGQRSKARLLLMSQIANGEAQIIVGTHALFQKGVEYHRLGFIVIDEQHRFGVQQRSKLVELAQKSLGAEAIEHEVKPHLLFTTATPIPRSLMMTVTGDLDVSTIHSKPKNRKPIKTQIAFESEKERVYNNIRKIVKQGQQAFIVCPLIDETENSIENNLSSAIQQHEFLQNEVFPELKCGLLHGSMFWYEKEEMMEEFAAGKYDIMVATTVIEVGIDIPNASLMLIENAERFGLAQLHQLRGRVGRSDIQSYCVLMTKDKLRELVLTGKDEDIENQSAVIRLKTMEDTNDGFKISEIDMRLRGPGDVVGSKQSGLPDFMYADIVQDVDLMALARDDASLILNNDPELVLPQNRIIKRCFDKIKAVEGASETIA